MISYLLSGWRVYVPDENGHPLYRGRVYFYDASTSEPSTVYADKEGVTPLGTYVDVDNHGYLPAIWLSASHLYKVVVKRLIQEDPETWNTMWEVDDVGNPSLNSEDIEGESFLFVNTISDLKDINPLDSERPDYVYVFGWYAPGDTGTPMLFRWVQNASGNDGHWIEPNNTGEGAWEQIFEGDIDPRKFGAVPDSGNACDTALVNCMRYASEPHTYDPTDPGKHYPKTVRFSKEGDYALNAEFDFSQFTMISQYDSAPVPVVVQDGVFLHNTVDFGKGARIESSSPIAFYPKFLDNGTYIKLSWFWIPSEADSTNQAARVVIIDKDTGANAVELQEKIVVNLMGSVPSGITMTDCVLIDAKNGALSAKMYASLLQIGEYLITQGFDSGNSYMKLFGNNNVEIFNMTANDPTFKEKLNLEKGFRIDANNYFEYDSLSSSWRLVADTVSSLNNIGNFKGDIMPQNGRNVVQIDLVNNDASQTLYKTETLNLADGALGWIIVVYGTQGGYMEGHIYNLLNQKSIDINIYGASGANLHLPIDTANIMIPVMRIGTSFAIGLPREIRTRRNSSDANQGCLITIDVSSI